ncbi:hypothetical protein NQ317_007739 [Molorchus minor]|uniref:mRNA (guanine-N(7))-methyltransferase n=1 Tax=Molorchus minor TaxID=1323400 RepID=A0ABQ9JWR4_9CUCU|nr:hypothetical protein NQ317_007739 [Molorchus minor]
MQSAVRFSIRNLKTNRNTLKKMSEIAELEQALVLAAADADSRQYSEQIIEGIPNYLETETIESSPDYKPENEGINGFSSECSSSTVYSSLDSNRRGRKRKLEEDEHETQSVESEDGYAKVVASHYNRLEEKGLDERSKSRIVYLRNFHNWIKSMLINEYLTKIKEGKKHNAPIRVHDMCGGKGGDLLKWRKGGITHLIISDIASKSLEQCQTRYTDMKNRPYRDRRLGNIYTIEYISADCTRQRLREKYSDPSMKLDLVSCQFAFHYSFESLPQAECMLRNASECLQAGGYFIGTIPDAYDLIARARRNNTNTYGNDVYQVVIDFDLNKPPLFGGKYNFHLDGVVDCPEFLVHFPTFVKLAKKYGLKLVRNEKFFDYFERMKIEGRSLLGNMKSLEVYPSAPGATLVGQDPEDYLHAKDFIKTEIKDNRDNPRVGTLSKSEWEASSIYTTFVFEKVRSTWNTDGTPIYDI